MIWRNCEWSHKILSNLWNEPNGHRFGYFHEQSRLDELLYDKYNLHGGENILNKLEEDIETLIKLDNLLILPYLYHRYFDDGEIKYIYHDGSDTRTKYKRIKNILN